MKFEELNSQLPNGFHDAFATNLNIDFSLRTLSVDLLIHYGTRESDNPNRLRPGRLTATSLYFAYIEPPDPTCDFPVLNGRPQPASGCGVKSYPDVTLEALARKAPDSATTFRFFLDYWNSNLAVCAGDVEFRWTDL